MKWTDRKTESKEVKKFLISQRYENVKVHHHRGTAWGWLGIAVYIHRPQDCYCKFNQYGQIDRCHLCKNKWQEEYSKLSREVQERTGRNGDYGGRISLDIDWIEPVKKEG